MANINIGGRLHSTATGNVVAGANEILDDNIGKKQSIINKETNDTLSQHDSAIQGLNSQNYVTVALYSELPAEGQVDTIYRVSSWDGEQEDDTKYCEYTWYDSDYVLLSIKSQVNEVFDISAHTNNTSYASLTAALGVNGGNVPAGIRRGGMSIKYIDSTSSKYVQYRYTATDITDASITTIANWQGIDDVPKAGSNNLAKSGGVYTTIGLFNCTTPASTSIKEVSVSGFSLLNGGAFKIKFANANTADLPTLNINSTGAKEIVFNGTAAGVDNSWGSGEVVEFYYDPTYNNNAGGYIGRSTVVTVSQNIETGHTNINIGGDTYPVASVDDINHLNSEEEGDKRILNGDNIPFKSDFYYRVDRNQEVVGTNCSYCRIRVNTGDKFIVTGASISSVAPFITVQEDGGTNHTYSETSGTNLLYTVEYNGWLIVNNFGNLTPSLKQTTNRFESINGQITEINGQITEINGQMPKKIELSDVDFARRTIFNSGNVPFIDGKYWNTDNNKEMTDSPRRYCRILLFAGTKIKITAHSDSASAKMLAEYPLDGSAPIISSETDVTDYEYTMQTDGYLVVNSMIIYTSAVKFESAIQNEINRLDDDIKDVDEKLGVISETLNLTSADYCGFWSNGNKIFSSSASYNGFLISVHTGTKYFWDATIWTAVAMSAYPEVDATSTIISRVSSGFIATEGMVYLLISLELTTTTSITVTTNGYGLVKDVASLKTTVGKNSVVNYVLVSGTLNGSGKIIENADRVTTKNFIDMSKNTLIINGATPSVYCYYDKNLNFLYFDTVYNESHVIEAAYCRLVFMASAAANLTGIDNGYFCNECFPSFKDITFDGVQINDGLNSTSASGVIMAYDNSSGLVAAPMAGGWLQYGESGNKIMMSVFPMMQPTNVKYVEVAAEGESMGNGHIYHNGIDVNVIALGSRVWRIMILSYRGTPAECFWVYRDYSYDTDTLSDAVEIKMNYGGESLSLNTDNRKSVISSISSLVDTASDKFVSIASSLDYHSDTGTYYGCITGYGYTNDEPDNVYPLLFYSTDNMATLVPFAVFPYSSQFEASCIKIESRIYCIGRQNGNIYHTGYSDDGENWTYKSITGTNNRPRLYNIDGKPMWCYGIMSPTSEMMGRGKIAIAHSTNPEEVTRVLEDKYGIVYFDIIIKNMKLFIAYSCSPLTIDMDNEHTSIKGKDMVKFVILQE